MGACRGSLLVYHGGVIILFREILEHQYSSWWDVVGVEIYMAESKFGKNLGPNVRCWAYSYLLYDKSSYHLMSQGASITERIFAWILMPLIRPLVGKSLKLNRPGTREKSLAVVESIFKEVWKFFPPPRYRLLILLNPLKCVLVLEGLLMMMMNVWHFVSKRTLVRVMTALIVMLSSNFSANFKAIVGWFVLEFNFLSFLLLDNLLHMYLTWVEEVLEDYSSVKPTRALSLISIVGDCVGGSFWAGGWVTC